MLCLFMLHNKSGSRMQASAQDCPQKDAKTHTQVAQSAKSWHLDLSSNGLTDEAVALLSLGFSDLANICSLDISHNPLITQQGLQVLCAFIFGVQSGISAFETRLSLFRKQLFLSAFESFCAYDSSGVYRNIVYCDSWESVRLS